MNKIQQKVEHLNSKSTAKGIFSFPT